MSNLPITVDCFGYDSVAVGDWALAISDPNYNNHVFGNSVTPANLDAIDYKVWIPQAGNYTLTMVAYRNNICPIVDVDIDGSEVASFDLNGVETYNHKYSETAIAITAGVHTVRFRVHGSTSGGYNFYLNRFFFKRE